MARLKQMYTQMTGNEQKMNTENPNPLTASGKRAKENFTKQYGDKGEGIFYATMKKHKMKHKWEQ